MLKGAVLQALPEVLHYPPDRSYRHRRLRLLGSDIIYYDSSETRHAISHAELIVKVDDFIGPGFVILNTKGSCVISEYVMSCAFLLTVRVQGAIPVKSTVMGVVDEPSWQSCEIPVSLQ